MLKVDAKLVLFLHVFLALVAVVGASTVVLQSEYMVLLCPIVVFLLPLITLLLWTFRRIRNIQFSGNLNRYIQGFRIAVITGWCISLLPGLFWGAIFFHIYEPWPFSLTQGPDTAYAEEGLLKVLGFNLETKINQVYYKGYDIRDDDRYLRFSSCSKAVEEKVVAGLEKEKGGERVSSFQLNSRLSWWFTASEALVFEHWVSDFREIWIDRQTCTFFVRSWTT